MKAMYVPTTCGSTMVKLNPEEDAGNSLSAQEAEHLPCSMEEKSNGSVIPTQVWQLMAWMPHMEFRDLKRSILRLSRQVAKITLSAQLICSARGSCGTEPRMRNHMPMDLHAINKRRVYAQVQLTGEQSTPTTMALKELASALTRNKIALQLLLKVPTP